MQAEGREKELKPKPKESEMEHGGPFEQLEGAEQEKVRREAKRGDFDRRVQQH